MQVTEQQVNEQIEQFITLARQFYNRRFVVPQLHWFHRGTNAGYAKLQNNEIYLNHVLFEQHPEYYMSDVIPHEIAHLICFTLFGRVKPHGKEWQSIMRQIYQLTPTTKHHLPCEHLRRVRQIDYMCQCGIVPLSMIRHNRVRKGLQSYRCKVCGETLSQNGLQEG
ncbi:SprT-like domain-containing protein [Glaciecola sp.]|nr:SprT-like domain-containing protein [Glaciecola sp.]